MSTDRSEDIVIKCRQDQYEHLQLHLFKKGLTWRSGDKELRYIDTDEGADGAGNRYILIDHKWNTFGVSDHLRTTNMIDITKREIKPL